jgi:hypothetical protein
VKIVEIKDYKSVQRWFTKRNGERRYKPKTEEIYIEYMQLFSNLSNKTPDELASCANIDKERDVIATGLEAKGLRILSIIGRITALNVFWRANGRRIDDIYGGIRDKLKTKIILREKATRA